MHPRTLLVLALLAVPAVAAPPEYPSFGREQRTDYQPNPDDIMRIWIAYINQGDGIVIQLPKKHRNLAQPQERIDVMIDAGANPPGTLMTEFYRALYPGTEPTIEYAVITHHDEDHVAGITEFLAETEIPLTHLYHNGLASYRRGKRGFPATGDPSEPAVFSSARLMGFLEADKKTFRSSHLIDDLPTLLAGHDQGEFHGVYAELADGVASAQTAGRLKTFNRATAGSPFINEVQSAGGAPLDGLKFEVLWPLQEAKAYESRSWSKTINGNSVTMKLTYGDFEMLFTGDHNKASETELLAHLKSTDSLNLLSCDVFKVPHHGSNDGLEEFFTHEKLKPVISVASLGEEGFQSKAMKGNNAWQHPSTRVIDWLGGPQRFYSTFTHEKRLDWAKILTKADRDAMIEIKHILIETDGQWFRIVEVETDAADYTSSYDVTKVKRSDGTRWIRAR